MNSKSHLDITALAGSRNLDELSTHTSRSADTIIYVGRKRKKSGKPSPAMRLLMEAQELRRKYKNG